MREFKVIVDFETIDNEQEYDKGEILTDTDIVNILEEEISYQGKGISTDDFFLYFIQEVSEAEEILKSFIINGNPKFQKNEIFGKTLYSTNFKEFTSTFTKKEYDYLQQLLKEEE